MAVHPLLVCDPLTTRYNFTHSLSWSDSCGGAEVLSDIPFMSVGPLVFGVSVLFLFLKRVSLSAVWLFLSALLAFVAAALDLGQTLAGEITVSKTLVPRKHAIPAREVLFAFSIGFRFLFYWSYVAEPPSRARCATSTHKGQRIIFLALERTHEPHGGSWIRWGLPGKLLGASLLAAIMTITSLQIVWRVVPRFHQYSVVYAADAALELLASSLLLLKLLLNTVALDPPDSMLVHTSRECFAPISGLLINIAVGVGDLLLFAFTESMVGRLLQAFEVYIIVVFVVVSAFLWHRDVILPITSSQDNARRDAVFTLPEPARQSTFRITIPSVETPRMSTVLGTATQNKQSRRDVLRRSVRRSLNHVSSWLFARMPRNQLRYKDEEVTLWSVNEGRLNAPHTRNVDIGPRASIISLTREPREQAASPMRGGSADRMSTSSASASQSTIARSIQRSTHNGLVFHPRRADVPRMQQTRNTATPLQTSPVYGLDGVQSLPSASRSQTPLDHFLREPSQLDQSIQAHRLFSTRTSTNLSSCNVVLNPKAAELTRSPSTGQRTVSSDVSLSNFPVPPWLTMPMPSLPSPRSSPMKRVRGDRRVRLAAPLPTPVQDTCTPLASETSAAPVDIPKSPCFDSVPHIFSWEDNTSLSAKTGTSSPIDSGGTRYNATSFIGGLATPGEPRQEGPLSQTENGSSARAIQTGSGTKSAPRTPPGPRRLEELLVSSAAAKLLPLAGPSKGDVADASADTMQPRVSDTLTIGLFPQTPSTRPDHTGETGSAERVDRVQRMLVRPRPPPLALGPRAEEKPGTPRAQVLADG